MRKNFQAEKAIEKIDELLPDIIDIEYKFRRMPIENGFDLQTQAVIKDIEEIEEKLFLNRKAAAEALYVK